jgi:hypothetical protein
MNIVGTVLTALAEFFATVFSPLHDMLMRRRGSSTAADEPPNRKPLTVILAVLVIIGSGVFIYWALAPRPPTINRAPFIGIGENLARETARAIDNHGRVVVVISEMHQNPQSPGRDQLTTFLSELKKLHTIDVAATEVIPPNAEREETVLSLEQLVELINRHATMDAIVSFVDLPPLPRDLSRELPKVRPKVIAFGIAGGSGPSYFKQKIVESLIAPRSEFVKRETPPKTPQEWFDMYFQVYTAANANTLPVY